MTLIVIDDTQIVADEYAWIDYSNGPSYVMNDFPKIYTLSFLVQYGPDIYTYPRMAFTGSAIEFLYFYRALLKHAVGKSELTLEFLQKTMNECVLERNLQVILPIKEGAIAIKRLPQHQTIVEFHTGPVLAFGAGRIPAINQGFPRVQMTWQEIFQHAIDAGAIPGYDINHLPHSVEVDHQRPRPICMDSKVV